MDTKVVKAELSNCQFISSRFIVFFSSAYLHTRFVKCCDVVKGRSQNPSSLKFENLYITLPDHGYHYYGAVSHNCLIISLQLCNDAR